MTNQDSAKRQLRDNNIIPIPGEKGTTFKVLIREKGYASISKTFPTRKEAREFRNKLKGSQDLLNRLGGSSARMTVEDVIDRYGSDCSGKDTPVPAKLEYRKDRLGGWKLADITLYGHSPCHAWYCLAHSEGDRPICARKARDRALALP